MGLFSIRKAQLEDAENIAMIKYRGWQDTYRGIISDLYLDAMSIPELEKQWRHILAPWVSQGVTDVMINEDSNIIGFIYMFWRKIPCLIFIENLNRRRSISKKQR